MNKRALRVGRDDYMIESTTRCPKSISNRMVEVWNVLPYSLRCTKKLLEFKKDLKTLYFEETFENTN